jgi:hypothetical protein
VLNQMNPEAVFDIALVLAVVGTVRGLRQTPWIAWAPTSAVRKTRLKIMAGVVSAALAVPFTLRSSFNVSPAALVGDWFSKAFLTWLLSMGAFDWLKMAMTIPNIFSESPATDDGGDIGDVDDNNRVDP